MISVSKTTLSLKNTKILRHKVTKILRSCLKKLCKKDIWTYLARQLEALIEDNIWLQPNIVHHCELSRIPKTLSVSGF